VPAQHETQKNETGRILLFPDRLPFAKGKAQGTRADRAGHDVHIGDLRRYEQGTEPDDFPQRMKLNIIAFAFIIMLTITGVWLAEQFALLRKQSDCIFLGRKNCVDVEMPFRGR
jgi:hypothetical protein